MYKLGCMSIKLNNKSLHLSSSIQKKSMDIHTNCTFNYQYRSSTEILMGFNHLYTYMYIILMKKESKRSCDIDKQDRLRGIAIINSFSCSNQLLFLYLSCSVENYTHIAFVFKNINLFEQFFLNLSTE